MSKFFSFTLYRQGLRKSRIAGITTTIILTVLSVLPPLIRLLTPHTGDFFAVDELDFFSFNLPLNPILFLAPIMTLNMFSYLNHRNESDFYHAIPFTRPCTFLSFMAAILTWQAFAIALGLTLAAILYWVNPETTFAFVEILRLLGVYVLASAFLSAMTALAMTVTGTLLTNLLIFALVASFARIIGTAYILCISQVLPIWNYNLSIAQFLLPQNSLPLMLSISLFSNSALSNLSLYIYTAVVTLLLLAAGCFLYSIRRSEMAGKTAPSRLMQHIYRCAITLPMVCLLATTLICDIVDDGRVNVLLSVYVSSITFILLCYYLYEIITTKRLKNCLSATPFLLVLLGGGLLFTGSIFLTRAVVLNYTPDAKQIKTVTLSDIELTESLPYYERFSVWEIALDDSAALELISAKLEETKTIIQTQGLDAYENLAHTPVYDKYGQFIGHERYRTLNITIVDKGGTAHGRYLKFSPSEYQTLCNILTASDEYRETVLSIPSKKIIDSYKDGYPYWDYTGRYTSDPEHAEKLWDLFEEEYNTFTDEGKNSYKNLTYSGTGIDRTSTPYISVSGTIGERNFNAQYHILPEYFPKTYTYWVKYFNEQYGSEIDSQIEKLESNRPYQVFVTMDASYKLFQHDDVMQCYEFLEAHKQSEMKPSCVVVAFSINATTINQHRWYFLTKEDANELSDLLIRLSN